MTWWEAHVGKPWEAVPRPPDSFNCGELVRHVFRERLGLGLAGITADAASLSESVRAFVPALFGLRPLAGGERPREFDCAFMARARYSDHCGIAVGTGDGLLVMHCVQGCGVVIESPLEVLGRGFARLEWFRHGELG
jgi:cell wall-associated NlpC family hydrolase